MKERIAAELDTARARTLALLAPFSDEELTRQVSEIMSAARLGPRPHRAFRGAVICRRLGGRDPLYPEGDDMYDAFAHVRSERPSLALLDPARALSYLGRPRAFARTSFERLELDPTDPLLRGGFAFGLSSSTSSTRRDDASDNPALGIEHMPRNTHPRSPEPRRVSRRSRVVCQGTSDEPWAYDNERPPARSRDGQLPESTRSR